MFYLTFHGAVLISSVWQTGRRSFEETLKCKKTDVQHAIFVDSSCSERKKAATKLGLGEEKVKLERNKDKVYIFRCEQSGDEEEGMEGKERGEMGEELKGKAKEI